MGTAAIFPGKITAKLLIVNSSVNNTSIHPGIRYHNHYTLNTGDLSWLVTCSASLYTSIMSNITWLLLCSSPAK